MFYKLNIYSKDCFVIERNTKKYMLFKLFISLISVIFFKYKVFISHFYDSDVKHWFYKVLFIHNKILQNHIHNLTRVKANDKNIIFIDDDNSMVYRIGFNEGKKLVRKNYEMLNEFDFINIPRRISFIPTKKYILSIESMAPGRVFSIDEFNFENNICKIISHFSVHYCKSSRISNINNWKSFSNFSYVNDLFKKIKKEINFIQNENRLVNLTLIHGDLTYRNILSHNDNLYFIDFDRSEIGFPEHDFFLLYFDYKLHISDNVFYHDFLNIILDDYYYHKRYIDIANTLYHLVPDFQINRGNIENIMILFILRTISFIIQEKKFNNKIDLLFLEKILKRIREGK